jgi:hypothetical protein
LETVASKNPSLTGLVEIRNFQFFGFDEYFSKRYFAK